MDSKSQVMTNTTKNLEGYNTNIVYAAPCRLGKTETSNEEDRSIKEHNNICNLKNHRDNQVDEKASEGGVYKAFTKHT